MTNKRYYTDNANGEPVYRDVNRCYPIHLEPEDPPLWMQGLWIFGITLAFACSIILLFSLV